VLSQVLLELVIVVGCGPTKLFEICEGNQEEWCPPLICTNVAAVNDETASASHWYGYFENGALSLSARRTMQWRFYAFAKHGQKIYQPN
jgi:hypothetical protein